MDEDRRQVGAGLQQQLHVVGVLTAAAHTRGGGQGIEGNEVDRVVGGMRFLVFPEGHTASVLNTLQRNIRDSSGSVQTRDQ
ncbi:hypothetical protein GCM10010247_30180 [Streptomyces calvus]|nr:hypothetical protein GCM10010247_30180 [Streptomyces calvus]